MFCLAMTGSLTKKSPPWPPFQVNLVELFYGPVIGCFDIPGEKTGSEFAPGPVIPDAFTAVPLSAAGFVGTCAGFFILCRIAVHELPNTSTSSLFILY
jgi:hypothetical protein